MPARQSMRIKLRVTADKMSAFARVEPGPAESAADLDAALAAAGIVQGIDGAAHSALSNALASEAASATELEIARGTAAGPSRAGRFEPAFHAGLQPGHVREDGTVDFHNRELLKSVSSGDTIGRLHPPIEGAAGVRIDGAPVPAKPPPPPAFRVGPGAELLTDGRIVAISPGVVIYVEQRSIEVGRHYVHEADVDLRSGDLSMEGSIEIRRDVQRGFAVRATGDIEIKGTVDGGSASAGGNLKIAGGVRGSEGSMLSAAGDLTARHADRARLDSGGTLALSSAVNSELSAAQIRIERSLRGGHAAAEIGLVTHDAGTSSQTETVVEAAVPREQPEADVRSALRSVKLQRVVAQRMARSGTADRPKGGKLARELADAQRAELARKIERAERQNALLPSAFVEVRGTAYAGVRVHIGPARLLVQNPIRNVRFTFDLERSAIRTEVASQ